MEVSGTLEKNPEFSGTFFHAKRSFERVLESPRRIEKLVEYSRIDGFVLYHRNFLIILELS